MGNAKTLTLSVPLAGSAQGLVCFNARALFYSHHLRQTMVAPLLLCDSMIISSMNCRASDNPIPMP